MSRIQAQLDELYQQYINELKRLDRKLAKMEAVIDVLLVFSAIIVPILLYYILGLDVDFNTRYMLLALTLISYSYYVLEAPYLIYLEKKADVYKRSILRITTAFLGAIIIGLFSGTIAWLYSLMMFPLAIAIAVKDYLIWYRNVKFTELESYFGKRIREAIKKDIQEKSRAGGESSEAR